MLDQDGIRRVDNPIPNSTEWERKAYILTDLGCQVLNAEIARMKKLLTVASTQVVAD
ncbi:MAG: hypothetical protein ACK2TU_00980 [Anaerolineales bacterium]